MRREEEKALADDEEKVISSGGFPPFWKPEIAGEQEEGELISVRTLELGDILHLRTDRRIIAVPVSAMLAEINFRAFIGQNLRFRFMGTSDTKAGYKAKIFRVTVLKSKKDEDVPF